MSKIISDFITVPYQKVLDITNSIEIIPSETKGEKDAVYNYMYRLYNILHEEVTEIKEDEKYIQEFLNTVESKQIDFYINATFSLQENNFTASILFFKDFMEYSFKNKEEKPTYLSKNEYILALEFVNHFYNKIQKIWYEEIDLEKLKNMIIEQTNRTEHLTELMIQNIANLDPRLLAIFKDWYDGKSIEFSYRNISLNRIKEKEKCSDIDAIFSMSTLLKNPEMLETYKEFDFRKK